MDLLIADLAEATGISSRTIRYYVSLGFLPRPTGFGQGARYTRVHLHRLYAIRALRRQGLGLEDIGATLAKMTPREIRGYVPKTPRPPEPEARPPDLQARAETEQARIAEEAKPPPRQAAQTTELSQSGDLPLGARWVIAPLLPGLALMVREDASAIVRRVATEIFEAYAANPP